jgi:hypothetical protein
VSNIKFSEWLRRTRLDRWAAERAPGSEGLIVKRANGEVRVVYDSVVVSMPKGGMRLSFMYQGEEVASFDHGRIYPGETLTLQFLDGEHRINLTFGDR